MKQRRRSLRLALFSFARSAAAALRCAAVVLSLLLCAGTAVLWGRSYWWADQVHYQSPTDAHGRSHSENVGSTLGTLFWHHYSYEARARRPGGNRAIRYRPAEAYNLNVRSWVIRDGRQWLGVGYLSRKTVIDGRRRDSGFRDPLYMQRADWAVFAPHWLVTLVFALPPMWWVASTWRRRRVRPPNLCQSCGYDIRATPQDSGALLERCPECGAVAKSDRRANAA